MTSTSTVFNSSSAMLSLGEGLSESSLINSSSSSSSRKSTTTTTTTTSGWANWSSRAPKVPRISVLPECVSAISQSCSELASRIAQLEKKKNEMQKQLVNATEIDQLADEINSLKEVQKLANLVARAKKGESIKISFIRNHDNAAINVSRVASSVVAASETSTLSDSSIRSSSSSRNQGDRETKEPSSKSSTTGIKRKTLAVKATSVHTSSSSLSSEVDDQNITKRSKTLSVSIDLTKKPNRPPSKRAAASPISSDSSSSSNSSSPSSDEDSDNGSSRRLRTKSTAASALSSANAPGLLSSDEDSDGGVQNSSESVAAAASSSGSSTRSFSYTTSQGKDVEGNYPTMLNPTDEEREILENIKLVCIYNAFNEAGIRNWIIYVEKDFPHMSKEKLTSRIIMLRKAPPQFGGKKYKVRDAQKKTLDNGVGGTGIDTTFIDTYNVIVRENPDLCFLKIVARMSKDKLVNTNWTSPYIAQRLLSILLEGAKNKDKNYFVNEYEGKKNYLLSSKALRKVMKEFD